MTDLSSSFLSGEEPELESIDFRQSLRFFQDQLILNGKGMSSVAAKGNNNNEGNKFNLNFTTEESEEGTLSSCRIAIPTVDTILESVRVLRAIQKSQEQRGATWSLHVASPDTSLQYLHLLAESQNGNVSDEINGQNNGSVSEDIVESVTTNGSQSSWSVKDQNGYTSNGNTESVADQNEYINTGISASVINGNKNGSLHDILTLNGKQNGTSSYPSTVAMEIYAHKDSDPHNGCNDTHLDENKELNQDEIPSFWPKSVVTHNQKKLANGSVKTSVAANNSNELLKTSNGVVDGTRVENGDLLQTYEIDKLHGTENKDEITSNGNETKKDNSIFVSEGKLPQENGASLENIGSTENPVPVNTNTSSVIDSIEVVEESTTEILKIGQNLSDISQIYRISWDSIDSNPGNNSLNEEFSNDSISEANCGDNSIKLKPPSQQETNSQPETDDAKKCLVDEESSEQPQKFDKDLAKSPNALLSQIDHLRPESVSDTSSSIYVSANCSPCASLYETDDNDLGYSNQPFDELKQNVTYETKSLQGVENLQPEDKTRTTYSSSEENENPDNLKVQEQNIAADSITTTFTSVKETDSNLHPNKLESVLRDDGVTDDSLKENTSGEKLLSTYKETKESPSENVLASQQSDLEYFELSVSSALDHSAKDEESDPLCEERTCEISFKNQTTIKLTNGNTSSNVEELIQKNQADIQITLESEEPTEIHGIKKFTTSSWNLEAIMESLYKLPDPSAPKITKEDTFKRDVYVLSEGAFCNNSEGFYTLLLQQQTLQITQESGMTDLLTLPLNYAEVSFTDRTTLKLDNKLGRCLYFKSEVQEELLILKEAIKKHCLFENESETINLVHYPLKCHQNVVIVDLGSCSTRAGILMDEPTLPFLFFPSVCATDKQTGNQLFGNEALQSEVRKNSTLSFPIRPSIKIVKHDIDINLVGGLFKKIFQDLHVDPTQFTIQVCLPRSLSINAQNALVKFLLEDLKVKSVSLTHQALLTLYAHNVSTGIVVDIGDRMDILPVVDGFIVENGVTRLPYGGQRLIHHMKHALAEKHISLSNDIDAFVVQYITENLSYIAENYDDEIIIANKYPQVVKKTIALQTFAKDDKCIEYATLDDARFNVPEGLFKPELWGLDNPGIHKLVQKAIQGTSVDVRKKIAENIYVSGGVTLIPGFVERLFKEVAFLNAPRIIPKVIASNYRYHSTYIGACKFSNMDVFPNVCIDLEEYSKNQASCLKKFVLCF